MRSALIYYLAALGICAVLSHRTLSADTVLKDAFASEFRVGVAIGDDPLLNSRQGYLTLAARQFNTATPENQLKWESVQPRSGEFDFGPGDRFVEFCEQNEFFVVGHVLVWHSQTPDWVFQDDQGNPLDRDALLARMRDHITEVVGHYRGRIHAWDVVNEALNDDGTLRDTPWLRIIGEDYLAHAFRFAQEADPEAELYYNDYNMFAAPKRKGAVRIVRGLQRAGCRIDGIGMQGHWGLAYPSAEEADASIKAYSRLGVKVMITELDVNVLPSPDWSQGADVASRTGYSEEMDPYRDGLPPEVQQSLAERYAELFRLFTRHSKKIDRVTFWGLDDGSSWRNNWPIPGRTAHPLLFDRQFLPKQAFHAVIAESDPSGHN